MIEGFNTFRYFESIFDGLMMTKSNDVTLSLLKSVRWQASKERAFMSGTVSFDRLWMTCIVTQDDQHCCSG